MYISLKKSLIRVWKVVVLTVPILGVQGCSLLNNIDNISLFTPVQSSLDQQLHRHP